MVDIEAYRTDVPLVEVVEHIVGEIGRPAYTLEDDPDNHNSYTIVEDESTKEAWDRALADLVRAVNAGHLRVSGRASKAEDLKELRAGDFPTRAHKFAGPVDLEVEYSGERILEFTDDGLARIVEGGGGFRVLKTDLRADFWEEVLSVRPGTLRVVRVGCRGLRKPLEEHDFGMIPCGVDS